jgi:acyl carrier protein
MSDTGTAVTKESVLRTVADLVGQVVGEDALFEGEITMETSFAADLGLESIEFVALSELLQEHYGDGVDFVGWISEMEFDDIVSLRVGSLVDFVHSCLT